MLEKKAGLKRKSLRWSVYLCPRAGGRSAPAVTKRTRTNQDGPVSVCNASVIPRGAQSPKGEASRSVFYRTGVTYVTYRYIAFITYMMWNYKFNTVFVCSAAAEVYYSYCTTSWERSKLSKLDAIVDEFSRSLTCNNAYYCARPMAKDSDRMWPISLRRCWRVLTT